MFLSLCCLSVVVAAPRDVQFRTIDTASAVVELRNFGATPQDLSGWRFCSHDENQALQYSSPTGLNGIVLAPQESLFVHFNNDAPGGDPSRINVSGIGGAFAQPLDNGPFGLQIYFAPVAFGNGNTIADHVQWSINGIDDPIADERSDEAQIGGVWTDENVWVPTTSATSAIHLKAASEGTVLHGPNDYEAIRLERQIQFRSLDTVAAVLEVHNFASTDVNLSGWRFCSHDEDMALQYSSPVGLNGVIIEAGTSIFVHFDNDAPGGDPDAFDVSTIGGGFAQPLDNGPYGLQLYFAPVNFGNGNTIADHIQWSLGGVDNAIADERSDEAETGGVWTDQDLWVATTLATEGIELIDGRERSQVSGPGDFAIQEAAPAGGQIPNGDAVSGTPLLVGKPDPATLRLTWSASCAGGDDDFELYAGTIGDFANFSFVLCTTAGATTLDQPMPPGDTFFMITPTDGSIEGSYGQDSDGVERGPATSACRIQNLATCSP